jgi:hypothetical protein
MSSKRVTSNLTEKTSKRKKRNEASCSSALVGGSNVCEEADVVSQSRDKRVMELPPPGTKVPLFDMQTDNVRSPIKSRLSQSGELRGTRAAIGDDFKTPPLAMKNLSLILTLTEKKRRLRYLCFFLIRITCSLGPTPSRV